MIIPAVNIQIIRRVMNKNWIVTAVNALTGEREPISQRMNRDDALAASKKEIRRGPGRAYSCPRPEQVKPIKLVPVQLQFQFEPW